MNPYSIFPGRVSWILRKIKVKFPKLFRNLIGSQCIPQYFLIISKLSFPLRISSVNATKSAGNCGFNHITEEIPNGKLHLWRSDVAAKMVNINQVLLMMIQ